MRPPILILGVPRSGTSLTAQLVFAWGVYSGDIRELHKADEWNKAGYYEHLPVRAMIKRMLDGHLVPTDSRFEVFEEPARELVRAMMKACPADRPWFWKIPEMTPLLPFWKQRVAEVTGTSPLCIVVVRNPVTSAHSQKRYFEQKALKAEAPDFPFGQALMVWQYYMAFLLNNKRLEHAGLLQHCLAGLALTFASQSFINCSHFTSSDRTTVTGSLPLHHDVNGGPSHGDRYAITRRSVLFHVAIGAPSRGDRCSIMRLSIVHQDVMDAPSRGGRCSSHDDRCSIAGRAVLHHAAVDAPSRDDRCSIAGLLMVHHGASGHERPQRRQRRLVPRKVVTSWKYINKA